MTTTPPPDTKVQSETLEQIANRIMRPAVNKVAPAIYCEMEIAIIEALRNERERCAKVAETAFAEFQTGHNAGKWIANAIRKGR